MRTSLVRILAMLFLAIDMIIFVVAFSSCNFVNSDVSTAKTSGYKLFMSQKDGFKISFEYPDSWVEQRLETHDGSIFLLLSSGNTPIGIDSYLNKQNGGEFENAEQIIKDVLKINSNATDFRVVNQTTTSLGTITGVDLTISYSNISNIIPPELPIGTDTSENLTSRDLVVDYKGRIYDISLLIDTDKYESIKGNFEHLIASFRFLD